MGRKKKRGARVGKPNISIWQCPQWLEQRWKNEVHEIRKVEKTKAIPGQQSSPRKLVLLSGLVDH